MQLTPLLTLIGRVSQPFEIGAAPVGTRRIYNVTGGEFEGKRLKGKVLPGGGEWFVQGADGMGQVDVRLLLETHDGAHIYMRYSGVMDFNEKIMETLAAGRASEYGDNLFLTQARFECGDERYSWLNHLIAVGEGRVHPDCVEYALYEANHG